MSYINSEYNFYGRNDILDTLKKRVSDLKEGYRQNVALLGNRYVGKSITLRHFFTNLDDDQVIAIYLDLDNKDFRYFVSKFVGSLLYNYSKNQKLPLHDDLALLMEGVKERIPHTISVIKKIQTDLHGKKFNAVFLGLMTLPEIFTNETDKFCVLVVDEFQNLNDFVLTNVFQELGKKIMTQKKSLYVFSSSYQGIAKKILSEKLSLLFGNFEILPVETFDLADSQKFIEHNLNSVNIGSQLSNFLTDFTGGHPLYLNLISQELTNLSAIHKQGEIYMPLLSQSIENTIFDRWGVLSRHFELIINELCAGKGNEMNSALLMSLANGHHKLDDLSEDMDIKRSQVTQKITRLMEMGIVIKNGRLYYFKDRLFKYWIKYVYQKRLKDVELAPDKQRRKFKEEINRAFDVFSSTSRKDFSSRVMELFNCFDNESFDLNGRKYKLPRFETIEPIKLRNENGTLIDVLRASSQSAVWFIILKQDSLGEGDVNAVLAESKSMKPKPERCLIITLSNLDEHAKLKALQERCWIWNEEELNILLTLFDKPFIS